MADPAVVLGVILLREDPAQPPFAMTASCSTYCSLSFDLRNGPMRGTRKRTQAIRKRMLPITVKTSWFFKPDARKKGAQTTKTIQPAV
jgi:hypothetical protein